ncbi:MAG: hypothetical protein LBC56_08145 [Oscillospiraceae bacterium]|jgi:acyl carrier protein|nr:hypothetical protein [Oscillospiraceae bacterium]
MNKDDVRNKVKTIFESIKKFDASNETESLFGKRLNFTSADAAYALIRIERDFQLNIQQLIDTIENKRRGFSLQVIVESIYDIIELA